MEKRSFNLVPVQKLLANRGMEYPIITSLATEEEVVQLLEKENSFFTKTDTVFESEKVSITRILDPLINLYDGEFLVNELFVATLQEPGRYKYCISYSPVRVVQNEQLPDRAIRAALVRAVESNWNLSLRR